MDFLDPKKKRQHTIQLFIGYALVGTALLLASTLLLFMALGYSINRSTGEVVQNGLLFVDAHPQQARIFLNGQDKGQTDGRFVLEAGNYNVELKRDGYRNWKRDFTLDGAGIVRLVYPFMFPEKLDTTTMQTFAAAPDLVTESPDRRWVIIHTPDKPQQFFLLDTSADTDKEALVPFTVPNGIFTSTTNLTLELAEWSTDNRHVLLKATTSSGHEFIMVDREDPAQSFNVSQVFKKSYAGVTLRDKKFDQYYLHDTATGQLLSGSSKTGVTEVVLEGVEAFWPYKANTLLYVTHTKAADDKAILKLREGQVEYTIRTLSRSPSYLLNMAEFDGETYVIGSATSDGRVYVYKNPVTTLKKDAAGPLYPFIIMRLENPQYMQFSNNARFISVQSGSKFVVYDFETTKQYRYDSEVSVPDGYKSKWMDGHRLMVVGSDNKMVVFDYDGLNKQTLVDAATAYVPLFDRDYNQLYTISPVSGTEQLGLVRTDLNLGEK